jgi:predicted transcriptional regulator
MLVRKQILVPSDIDGRIRRLARQKGVSQSALVVEAIEALPDWPEQVERILAFAGVIDNAPGNLSEEVDAVLYN